MKTRNDRLRSVEDMFVEEHRAGFQNGVAYGHSIAERIFLLWFTNDQLKEPSSIDTLEKWSREALDELKKKLEQKEQSRV